MAITDYTPSATSGTERDLIADSTSLAYSTTDAEVEVQISLVNMAAGDMFRFRFYEKSTAGSSAEVAYECYREGAQSKPLLFPRRLVGHGWTVTAKKEAGSDRVFPLSVRTVDGVSGTVSANVTQWNGTNVATPTTAGVPRVDVKAMEASTLTASAIASSAITAAKFAANAIDANAIAADAVAEIQSGLATSASQTTIIGYIDTEVAAIKAKTDNLPSDPADASDVAAAFSTVNGTLSTIAGYIDTEVAAIKAKTDNLPSDPADASDIAAAVASLSTAVAAVQTSVDAVPTAAENAAALMSTTIETGISVKAWMQIVGAIEAGELTGMDDDAPEFLAMGETGPEATVRVTATTTTDGRVVLTLVHA